MGWLPSCLTVGTATGGNNRVGHGAADMAVPVAVVGTALVPIGWRVVLHAAYVTATIDGWTPSDTKPYGASPGGVAEAIYQCLALTPTRTTTGP